MLSRIGLALWCLVAPLAAADVIPIVNPSFESLSRPLVMGEQTNGAGGLGVLVGTRYPFGGGPAGVGWDNPIEVLGWRTFLRPFGDPAANLAGVLNPPLISGQPFMTGQDGQHVLAIQASRVGQTLHALVQPSTHYHLEFLGGVGLFGTDYFLAVSLIAVPDMTTLPLENEPGVSRLVLQSHSVPAASHGSMLLYTLDYTTPATLPPEWSGKHLGIHLFGSDGIPRVVYDNFVLTGTPVPSPSTLAPFAIVVAMGRRRSR